MMGTPVFLAIANIPGSNGWTWPSGVRVPSGNIISRQPCLRRRIASLIAPSQPSRAGPETR